MSIDNKMIFSKMSVIRKRQRYNSMLRQYNEFPNVVKHIKEIFAQHKQLRVPAVNITIYNSPEEYCNALSNFHIESQKLLNIANAKIEYCSRFLLEIENYAHAHPNLKVFDINALTRQSSVS